MNADHDEATMSWKLSFCVRKISIFQVQIKNLEVFSVLSHGGCFERLFGRKRHINRE